MWLRTAIRTSSPPSFICKGTGTHSGPVVTDSLPAFGAYPCGAPKLRDSAIVSRPGSARQAIRCGRRAVFGAIVFLTMALASKVSAQIPDTPLPVSRETKVEHRVRLALLAGVAAARAADWHSTGRCLGGTNAQSTCHEAILPAGLATSKSGLAAFEASAWAVEFDLSRRMAQRHPKLAIVSDAISFASLASVVIHNYLICRGAPSPPTTQVEPPPGWRITIR